MTIHQSIISLMGDIAPIAKGRKNAQQGFAYRGIDDIMNELQPLMVKHKIFCVPEVLENTREERQTAKGGTLLYSTAKIKYTFYAEDGSSVSAVVLGEGMDSGDKASNKAMAVGMKYALLQTLCIPTEDTKDPDAESHNVKQTKEPDKVYACESCGAAFEPFELKGKKYSAEDAYNMAVQRRGRGICKACYESQEEKLPWEA